jgi:mRNA-degrading endonuclease RelE of RelBE toxin-antitoxin system
VTAQRYQVSWAPSARRDLHGLPGKTAVAVVEFVYGSLADNPQRVGRALQLDFSGYHSARRGDYRVLYTIDDAKDVVRIVAADHRADVYRGR